MHQRIFAVSLGLFLLPAGSQAAPGHLKPESGSPLRLVLVEDGNALPQQLSDGGVIGAGIISLLGASAISWWAHDSETDLYTASALADIGLAMALTNAITFPVKSLVSRARPYTYSENYPGSGDKAYSEYQQNDAYHSFPSGHTSNTAAFMFSLATTAAYHMPEIESRTWVVGGLYGLATAATLMVAQMRVQGGYHFYSDVFTGGLIGIVCGIMTPILHHKLLRSSEDSNTSNATIGLAHDQDSALLTLGGRF